MFVEFPGVLVLGASVEFRRRGVTQFCVVSSYSIGSLELVGVFKKVYVLNNINHSGAACFFSGITHLQVDLLCELALQLD